MQLSPRASGEAEDGPQSGTRRPVSVAGAEAVSDTRSHPHAQLRWPGAAQTRLSVARSSSCARNSADVTAPQARRLPARDEGRSGRSRLKWLQWAMSRSASSIARAVGECSYWTADDGEVLTRCHLSSVTPPALDPPQGLHAYAAPSYAVAPRTVTPARPERMTMEPARPPRLLDRRAPAAALSDGARRLHTASVDSPMR